LFMISTGLSYNVKFKFSPLKGVKRGVRNPIYDVSLVYKTI